MGRNEETEELSPHPWNGRAQDAPLKGAGISNIDYMNAEVAIR